MVRQKVNRDFLFCACAMIPTRLISPNINPCRLRLCMHEEFYDFYIYAKQRELDVNIGRATEASMPCDPLSRRECCAVIDCIPTAMLC